MGFAPPGPFNFKPLFTYVTGGAIAPSPGIGFVTPSCINVIQS